MSERKYELYSQEFKRRAYEVYAAMRRDNPVFCQPGLDGKTPIWFVTGYDEVETVLRDDRRFVRNQRNALTAEELAALPPLPPLVEFVNNNMLNQDGADHRRLRALVNKAFTPRMINQMRGRIQTIADELLDAVQEQGEMDLVEAFAFPLPITVIAELLGIPLADQDKFRLWSDAIITPNLDPAGQEQFMQMMMAFITYLRALFDERRQAPQNDLITALIQAEEAQDKLNEAELFSMVILLIVAGHETTVSLIGNGALALLQNPEQMTLLRENPALMPTAVEEFLRYDSPIERALTRWAAADVSLGGCQIKRGDPIIPIIGAADRDPAHFADPDRLEIQRQPNRHLAFGHGAHYCLGAPLARLEGEIAFNTLLRRLPNLRLNCDPDELTWRLIPLVRGLTSLPVAW